MAHKITAGSILRMCEYRELSKLNLGGKVLDLGGSVHSGYQEFCRAEHIDTSNSGVFLLVRSPPLPK